MKNFILLIISLLIPSITFANDGKPGSSEKDPIIIGVQPIPKPIPSKGPKDPTQSPLTCVLMGDCLSVFCHYDAMGEVSVFNNETMETIATESGNLGEGIILILDNYTLGTMSLTVTMSGTTYVGNF